MVYNGYYKVMSNIPKMGQLPTPVIDDSDFQGSKKCQAPWCLDGVAHELLGVQDEALPDPAGDIRPKRRAVSGDVKNRDFDWDMGPKKKPCYTTYITYNLFIYIYIYINIYICLIMSI